MQVIFAVPRRTASTVMCRSSLTRIPVAQMVSMTSLSQNFFCFCAAFSKCRYSFFVSSFSPLNMLRWHFTVFTRSSGIPAQAKKRFSDASMVFAELTAYRSRR